MSGVSYPRRTELARGGPGAFAVAAALVAGFLFVGGAVYVALSGTSPLSNPGSSNIALGPTPHSSLPIFEQPTPTPSPPPTVEITPWFFSASPSADLTSPFPSFSIEPFPTDTPLVTPTVGPPGAPVANFRGSITSSDGLTVAWHDLSTGTVSQWSWDFGDGAGSQAQNPTHRYSQLGDYQVTLSVSGPLGSDSATKVLHLRPQPTPTPTPPPQIAAAFTCSADASTLSVTCDGSASTGATSWSWSWGDNSSGSGKTAGHTYGAYGDYTITLTVSGPAGSDSKSKVLHLNPSATPTPTPSVVARFSWAQVGDSMKVDFDATSSSGNITSYTWDFGGDGTGGSNEAVTSFTYDHYGPYTVKLTVSGPDGTATRTHNITISGPGPTPTPTDTPSDSPAS